MARARPPVHPDLRRARRADRSAIRRRCCALAGALSCMPVALLRATTREGIGWRNVLDALVDGARNTLAVAMACACAGIVIGCVTITGLGIVFTQFVIALSQNSLVAGAGADRDRRHRPRHGHADHARLHRDGVAAGAGGDQARRHRAGGAHVRVLLRDPVGDHAAGGAGGVRRGGPREGRPVERRLGGGAAGGAGVHRAVHVRLRAVAAADRRLVHQRARRRSPRSSA